jgi:hypothetical protein
LIEAANVEFTHFRSSKVELDLQENIFDFSYFLEDVHLEGKAYFSKIQSVIEMRDQILTTSQWLSRRTRKNYLKNSVKK